MRPVSPVCFLGLGTTLSRGGRLASMNLGIPEVLPLEALTPRSPERL